jgi:hypothetical protein
MVLDLSRSAVYAGPTAATGFRLWLVGQRFTPSSGGVALAQCVAFTSIAGLDKRNQKATRIIDHEGGNLSEDLL